MARASIEIIEALRKTACKIERSSFYQWGHMGSCNCGFLAQEITKLTKEEIHRKAMLSHGDWSEQLNDYCPDSGLAMNEVIHEMLNFGFDSDDLKNLERLADSSILSALPHERRYLRHNFKPDVVVYLKTWASLLEKEFVESLPLPDVEIKYGKHVLSAVPEV